MSAPLDFSALKKTRKSSLENLSKKVEQLNKGSNRGADDRFWKPEPDSAGNGYAVLRLLPPPVGEDLPFVQIFDHGFQGPGGWYIENSLTTLGKDDPCSEYNSKLWNSGVESNKDIARKQKRRLNFYANIYVVDDKMNPSNNGKTFLWKFGKKIFEKINEAMHPSFEDEDPINPFDLWEGANFKLKIRQYEGYRNYDKSEFGKPEPLFDDDDKLEEVWKSQHSLQELVDPKNFKSYDELKSKLEKVLGIQVDGSSTTRKEMVEEEPKSNLKEREEVTRPEKSYESEETKEVPWDTDEDDDDDLEHFKKILGN